MGHPFGNGHINTAVNARDPRRTAKRAHNAGGAQNRNTAHNPKARVPCFLCNRRTIWHGNGDPDICAPTNLSNHFIHHSAWHRINRGLTHRDRQPCLGHMSNTLARVKADAISSQLDTRFDQRTVGYIRIVTCILDDARLGPTFANNRCFKDKNRCLTFGQSD